MTTNTDKASDASALGCVLVVAVALITIGAAYEWGPIALVVIGGVILAWVLVRSPS